MVVTAWTCWDDSEHCSIDSKISSLPKAFASTSKGKLSFDCSLHCFCHCLYIFFVLSMVHTRSRALVKGVPRAVKPVNVPKPKSAKKKRVRHSHPRHSSTTIPCDLKHKYIVFSKTLRNQKKTTRVSLEDLFHFLKTTPKPKQRENRPALSTSLVCTYSQQPILLLIPFLCFSLISY